jgi:hypothetical protein
MESPGRCKSCACARAPVFGGKQSCCHSDGLVKYHTVATDLEDRKPVSNQFHPYRALLWGWAPDCIRLTSRGTCYTYIRTGSGKVHIFVLLAILQAHCHEAAPRRKAHTWSIELQSHSTHLSPNTLPGQNGPLGVAPRRYTRG